MSEEKWIHSTCKIGQGAECCKYLIAGGKGFECAKTNIVMKDMIDSEWAKYSHIAQGDNCEGQEDSNLNQ